MGVGVTYLTTEFRQSTWDNAKGLEASAHAVYAFVLSLYCLLVLASFALQKRDISMGIEPQLVYPGKKQNKHRGDQNST